MNSCSSLKVAVERSTVTPLYKSGFPSNCLIIGVGGDFPLAPVAGGGERCEPEDVKRLAATTSQAEEWPS